jgi:hypothetical protein
MRREDEDVARRLLASCSALLCDEAGPQGTAFFVAPGYAITAAHLVRADGLAVRLSEGTRTWYGRVTDIRPPCSSVTGGTEPYPAPDIALITIDDGPTHGCALLGRHLPGIGTRVMARGYTRTFEFAAGRVIGMLRTSRQLGSNLGGWVVPAELIRQTWPEEAGRGSDLFHRKDESWRQHVRQLRARSQRQNAPAQGGLSIGTIIADVAPVITGGEIGTFHIENHPEHDHPPAGGTP